MKKTVIVILAFITGGVSGGFAVARYFKDKYEKIADAEIKSTVEVFRKKYESDYVNDNEKDIPQEVPEESNSKTKARKEYEATINKYTGTGSAEGIKSIEILRPEEFNASGNKYKTLDLYADGVLAYHDTMQKLSDADISLHVGPDAISQIGRYEPDAIHVRNNRFNIDYEIIRQTVTYDAALSTRG